MISTERIQPNLVTVADMDAADAIDLIHEAQAYKAGKQAVLTAPAYAVNLFFENSTRTKTSFQMAQMKLGMNVLEFEAGTSSVKKGESLYDTVKTMESIGVNVAVIRHPENEYYNQLINHSDLKIGIVNGGDGSGQHPSQCLLDMMTINEEFGDFKGLKVLIIGDLSHSRVAHSNAMMLNRLGAEVYFAGPEKWYDPTLEQYGTFGDFDELLPQMDVVNLLRVQNERLTTADGQAFDANQYHQAYGLTLERAAKMKQGAIIMHPAPVNRGVEIDSSLVEAPNSRIFQQMANGVYTRMAILSRVLRYQGLM
ncbi:aspartate carbamoyltransferase catalytic subunit [Lactobacillus reuteri]|uniref:Aspartate carbamoyltransferase n=1 Tax=Limosilactobacillus reuteri TaxID=1598 RepID=A0A6L5P6K5_LIMRT|nr:aspartate carbamoyltransferase catalytic subunit [Limosilactobacillus reuteri]MRH09292.1 aspartate carbamoyltransferase catalytic subunit [Limosilactobacillus reuteri]